ncbi:hypothetical protein [Novosphingobium sp. ST904]|uniref:hypothetical protein n=1 Tax=Novosphingobium sp. ST904 TaxID=1684385 RepID=UPI0006C8DA82|nr:hypothetical protein [Novosphingobium sp. ST904]TCM30040.1 hypothetical protein EDF59_12767 [Novosphingobium sp. ST904]
MPCALLFANHQPPAPTSKGHVTFVDRDSAAGVVCGFLSALEADGGAKTPFMQYAQASAERALRRWGVTR